jgi:hypothetical protein
MVLLNESNIRNLRWIVDKNVLEGRKKLALPDGRSIGDGGWPLLWPATNQL